MKKKFASYLLTGKAATLPFYAANSMAQNLQEHIAGHPPCLIELPSDKVEVTSSTLCKKDNDDEIAARITGCPGDKGKGPNAMTVVVVGLQAGDVVFLVAADDRDGYTDWDPKFRLGKGNTRFAASLVIPPRELPDIEELIRKPLGKIFHIGGSEIKSAGEAVSLPINLAKLPKKEGFNLQAIVLRTGEDGETKLLFSEADRIERTVEAGEECPPQEILDVCDPTDTYGGASCGNNAGDDDDDDDDSYGGSGSSAGDDDDDDDDSYGGSGNNAGDDDDDDDDSYGGGSY